MEVREEQDPTRQTHTYRFRVTDTELAAACYPVMKLILETAAKELAQVFIREYGQEVLAKLDPQAIANLAVAEAAGEISKAIKQKFPDKILEVERIERRRRWF